MDTPAIQKAGATDFDTDDVFVEYGPLKQGNGAEANSQAIDFVRYGQVVKGGCKQKHEHRRAAQNPGQEWLRRFMATVPGNSGEQGCGGVDQETQRTVLTMIVDGEAAHTVILLYQSTQSPTFQFPATVRPLESPPPGNEVDTSHPP